MSRGKGKAFSDRLRRLLATMRSESFRGTDVLFFLRRRVRSMHPIRRGTDEGHVNRATASN